MIVTIFIMKMVKALPIFLIPILLLTGIAPIGVAYASKPMTGSGTFTTDAVVQYGFKFNGDNIYFKYDATYTFSGPIDAILTITGGECTVHPNGKGTCLSYGTFDGTIGGRTGTAYGVVPATLNPDGISYQGTATSISGTGELENLHLVNTFEGLLGVGPDGTYTTQYHFDP